MTTTTVCRVARNYVQPQLSSIESTQWATGLSHPLTILPISCDVVCNTQYCWGVIVCASFAKQNQHLEQIYVMAYFIKDTDTLRTLQMAGTDKVCLTRASSSPLASLRVDSAPNVSVV
jgi:hypothetical protein